MKLTIMLLFVSLFSSLSCGGSYLLIEIDEELNEWYLFLCEQYTQPSSLQIFKQKLINLVNYIKCPYELKQDLLKLSPFGSSMFGVQGNNYLILALVKNYEYLIYPGMGVLTVQRDKVKREGVREVNKGQENQTQGLESQATEKEEIQLMTTIFITRYTDILAKEFAKNIKPKTITHWELLHNIIEINNQIKAKNFLNAKVEINRLIDKLLKQSGTYNDNLVDKSDGVHNHVYLDTLYENHVKTEKFKQTIKDTLNYLYENLFVIYFQQAQNVSYFGNNDEEKIKARRDLYEDYVEEDMSLSTSLNNIFSTSTKNQFIKHYFYCDHFTKEQGTNANNKAKRFCREAGKDNLGDIVFVQNLTNMLGVEEAKEYSKNSLDINLHNTKLQNQFKNLNNSLIMESAVNSRNKRKRKSKI
jgi:hypothetical protein